jgi:hypothetical protein
MSGQLMECHKESNSFRILAINTLGINTGHHNAAHIIRPRSEKLLGVRNATRAQYVQVTMYK